MERTSEEMQRAMSAIENAKRILKAGDRVRLLRTLFSKDLFIKSMGRSLEGEELTRLLKGRSVHLTYTFQCWDGDWIVSASGINDIAPIGISQLNGQEVDFSLPLTASLVDAGKAISEGKEVYRYESVPF